jgi:hypothetical protein
MMKPKLRNLEGRPKTEMVDGFRVEIHMGGSSAETTGASIAREAVTTALQQVPIVSENGVHGHARMTAAEISALREGEEVAIVGGGDARYNATTKRLVVDAATAALLDAGDSPKAKAAPLVVLSSADEKMIADYGFDRDKFIATRDGELADAASARAEIERPAEPRPNVTKADVVLSADDEKMIADYGFDRDKFIATRRLDMQRRADAAR